MLNLRDGEVKDAAGEKQMREMQSKKMSFNRVIRTYKVIEKPR